MLDDVISAPRTDSIYNMHGYLTKVPVQAIIPLIREFTPDDGWVVDMFAGSGMTAIASKMAGRNAVVSDISRLGQHIGQGYLTPVNQLDFIETAERLVAESKREVGWLYDTFHTRTGDKAETVRAVWSFVYGCSGCESKANYYEMMKAANWDKKKMQCPNCSKPFDKKASEYLGDEPVVTVVKKEGEKQLEQPFSVYDKEMVAEAERINFRERIPSAEITPEREMYHRSALKKWGTTNTKDFFSQRNSAALYDLWSRIRRVQDEGLQKKLLFALTAILPRASKRYQWSPKVPLNAANQNYYIAPVFYEWNVYELFMRKASACIKSDNLIFNTLESNIETIQRYVIASADDLSHLNDNSVNFVFADPPFGSNIFYSDMNLFQEVWLGTTTNHEREAVIRTTRGQREGSARRYTDLLTGAFKEAHRVLEPGGVLSIVFGNSKGSVWAMAQRAFKDAGFTGKPVRINILDKGQRSVKGLASGTEGVATLDLIVSLRKGDEAESRERHKDWSDIETVRAVVDKYADMHGMTASHLYLEVLRQAIYEDREVGSIDLAHIVDALGSAGYSVSPDTGRIFKEQQ